MEQFRGLIGKKLKHSFSPLIHQYLTNKPYRLIELEDIEELLKEKKFSGINVTIPYKQQVIPYLDELDKTALKVQAVNTIKNDNGKLIGYNTDYDGFKYLLEKHHIIVKNQKVIVCGKGGASKAIKAVLEDLQVKEIITSYYRDDENCKKNDQIYQEDNDATIIINTTPVGMYPNNNEQPIDLTKFKKLTGVIDIIYNPLKTNLVLQAEALNINCCSGLEMLIVQAIKAIEIFDGISYINRVDEIYQRIINGQRNIVLIGMPSCGKTTSISLLKNEVDYQCIDIDQEIIKDQNKSVKEIFEEYSEAYFRALEHQKVLDLAKLHNLIISTGGGVVLNPDNMRALKQNGLIIYIKRDVSKLLSDSSRPLCKNAVVVENLYQQRKDLYEKYADITIDNNNAIENTINNLLEVIKGEKL